MLDGRFGAQGRLVRKEGKRDSTYHARQGRQQIFPLFLLVVTEKSLDFNGFVLVRMMENLVRFSNLTKGWSEILLMVVYGKSFSCHH